MKKSCEKMTELKTLKNIKGIYSNGNFELGELHINHKLLKAEAIKWVQNWIKIGGKDFNKNQHKNEIYSFMSFFNIKNEEVNLEQQKPIWDRWEEKK